MDQATIDLLRERAARYETADFLQGDPSWFMHQVEGDGNREVTAFIASALSFGSRPQFMGKVSLVMGMCRGDALGWVRDLGFMDDIPDAPDECFYRMHSKAGFRRFLMGLSAMLREHGSIGNFVMGNSTDCLSAIRAITGHFSSVGACGLIPRDATSACKRLCMFMRWMVRDGSPVDLGLWSGSIDRRTLIIPMDTHVLRQARRLGLTTARTASMPAAARLTGRLAEAFPDDPLKGDFALFGFGVENRD